MKAIIVAGGRGERLKPLTDKLPKTMIGIGGKPVLEHVIIYLRKYNIRDLIISLCFMPGKITSYFGDGSKWGVNINYIFEGKDRPLGTAGAILQAGKFVGGPFIATYADILRELDIAEMVRVHKNKKAFATIAVYPNKNPDPKSIIGFDNNKKIFKFVERPGPEDIGKEKVWSNASFYILEPGIFDYIPREVKSDFGHDIFPKIIKTQENIYAFETYGYFADIGTIEKLEEARKAVKTSNPDSLQSRAR